MSKLPTKRDTERFMRAINRGRKAFGLEPIDKLDFDGCTPGSTRSCLSATHLIKPIDPWGASVGGAHFLLSGSSEAAKLARTLGTSAVTERSVIIPPSIRTITDPFDERMPGLRERLVEHGVVDG